MSRPRDHDARERAAGDFASNLVVSAGAGTGKTTLIVERMLSAIGSGTAPLSRIAAITFTEKAAGELSERLARELRLLSHLARGGRSDGYAAAVSAYERLTTQLRVPAETVAARASEAEAMVDRAAVSTIHGFCAELLRAHPLAVGLAPGFTVDRGPTGRRLAAEEWPGFLAEELAPTGPRVEVWERLVGTFKLPVLLELGTVLASGAVSERDLRAGPRSVDLHAVLSRAAQEIAGAIRTAVDAASQLPETPRVWLVDAEAALRTFVVHGAAAARRFLSQHDDLIESKPSLRTKKLTAEQITALDALAGRARALAKAIADDDPGRESDVLSALIPFARRLRARQTRAGIVDFDGLLVRARDLLRDAKDVRALLKARFDMILVDEFQDTDPIQYEIVFFLAERADGDASDAYETRLAPGKLFIVGDDKQSIYRFRGADYAAATRAADHVLSQGGEKLTLFSNFRSSDAVLRSINALFAEPGSKLWRPSSTLARYVPIEAQREGGEPNAVEVWSTVAGPKAPAAERRGAEGRALAAEIPTIAGAGKPYRYEDVLVLFRSFSELEPYLRALREAMIPFVVTGGRTFHERAEIVQAMAVLRAVADPENAVAELAFRRSPAGGVPDTELHAAAVALGAPTPALDAADRRLRALRAAVAKRPVGAAIRHVLDASGLIVLAGLAFEGAQRVANLEKLQLAADEISHDGHLSLLETIDELEKGFASDEEGDSPLADEGRDAVRVMTIHAAKGLEARVVILADAAAGRSNQPPRKATARMVRLAEGEFLRIDSQDFRNAAALAAGVEDPAHDAAEDVRLLYVALTRARDRLIVLNDAGSRSRWAEAIAAWRVGVTHRVARDSGPLDPVEAPPSLGAKDAAARYDAAVAAIRASAGTVPRPPSGADVFERPSRVVSRPTDPELAREVGRIVHLRLAGLPVEALGPAAEAAAALLDAPAGASLRERLASLEVLGREVPMLFHEDDAIWRGTIDLIYRDTVGRLVVADFKTDASDDDAIARHREQLRIYAAAVAKALGEQHVRSELWMLRRGNVLEV